MCRMSRKSGNLKLLEPSGPHRGLIYSRKFIFFLECRWLQAAAFELRDSRQEERISKLLLGAIRWKYEYSGDRSLNRDSAPASCRRGIIACWSSWPTGVGSTMMLEGSQNVYVTGRIHEERSVRRKNIHSKNKAWWKLHTMDYLIALLRDRGCISLRHCIIQLSEFAYFLFPHACTL
jgi:hypothetical protein